MEKTMIFSKEDKEAIGKLVVALAGQSGMSNAKYARSVGFNPADLSNLRGEKWKENPSLIGDSKWIRLARLAQYSTKKELSWETCTTTSVYSYVSTQLKLCQAYSFCNILVDRAGIGKTHACRHYARNNINVFYVDGSTCPQKNSFIKALATAVGVEAVGRYADILADTIFVLASLPTPLVIIDEAGDLEDSSYRVLKSIQNRLDGRCGIYMLGADGLRRRLERGIKSQKVGFTEVFSRFGKGFGSVAPPPSPDRNKDAEYEQFIRAMAIDILAVNGITGSAATTIIDRHSSKDLRAIKRAAILTKATTLKESVNN